jgi:hypothetical protein
MWIFLLIFSFCLHESLAAAPYTIPRDGPVTNPFEGWTGLVYRALRWEPICGTLGTYPRTLVAGNGECDAALNQFSNMTDPPLAYFDSTGVRLVNTGVGMGRDMCLCFSLSPTSEAPVDICWLFNGIGQVMLVGNGYLRIPTGAHRPGAYKSLHHCEAINIAVVESSWSATAPMPSFHGNIETLGPSTILATVTETRTITPTRKLHSISA